ncbi:MAG: hypothetical protein IJ468_11405, partial [Lachnospiraceae bacterium]|nr:hypothetical protein [Lachnospiraceae bacterium]
MKLHEFQRVCNRVKLSQRQSDRLFAWAQRAVLESEKKRERKNDFFIGTVVGIATIAVLLMALTIPMAWNMRKEGEVPLMSAAETLEGTEIGDVDNTNQTQVSYLTVSGESDVETCAEILSQMQDGSIVYLEDLQAILAQDPGILTQNGIVCAQPTDETLHQLFVYRKFGLNH